MFALVAVLATLHLTVKDNKHAFTVKPQTPIVVTLLSNPSTGYHWKYEASAGGGTIVRLVSHKYVAPKKGSPPGTAGKEIWHLRAVAKGSMAMVFRYLRSFGSSRPAKKIGIVIRVR